MPSVTELADRLNGVARGFPGIAQRPGQPCFRGRDGLVEAPLAFDDGAAGTAARLVIEHIVELHFKPINPIEIADDGGLRLSLDAPDAARFARALGYAGPDFLAPARPHRELARVPLPSLLSHALIAFERDYAATRDDVPTLPVWSNVLRVFGDASLTDHELGECAILSKRVVRVLLRDLTRLGWLEADPDRARAFRLTDLAKTREAGGRRRLAEVERDWRERHGLAVMEKLRDSLATVGGAARSGMALVPDRIRPERSLHDGRLVPPSRTRATPSARARRGVARGSARHVRARGRVAPVRPCCRRCWSPSPWTTRKRTSARSASASVFLAASPGRCHFPRARQRHLRRRRHRQVGTRAAPMRGGGTRSASGRGPDGLPNAEGAAHPRLLPGSGHGHRGHWREAFGAGVLDGLRDALETLDADTIPGTPD